MKDAEEAILDLMAIIPFGVYPTPDEARRATAAVITLRTRLQEYMAENERLVNVNHELAKEINQMQGWVD